MEKNAYILPYLDVNPTHPNFQAIQKIGATGILKGHGVPYKWANQTWFYPDREISQFELMDGLRPIYPQLAQYWSASGEPLTGEGLLEILAVVDKEIKLNKVANAWDAARFGSGFNPKTRLSRAQVAVLLDRLLNPFAIPVGLDGNLVKVD